MTARAARIGLWLAAVFVFFVLGSWMLLPMFISSEFVRTAIERELTDIAGQRIHVAGRVDLDLFPSPIARLYDLRVPRLRTDSSEHPSDFLAVDIVEVAIPMSSLLARQPTFSQFRLIRPVMRVAIDGEGRVDFGGIGGRLGREIARLREEEGSSANEEAKGDVAPLHYTRFGTVAIENGTVEFTDPATETPEKVTAVTGTVSWPRLDDQLTTSLKGIWRGTAFEQKAEIDNAIRFFASRITGVRLNFTSDTVTYSFDGKMGVGTTPFAEGSVQLKTPSLRKALDWLQTGIQPGRTIGNVALTGTIRADAKKIRFEDLQLSLQGSTGKGVLELAFRENGKPSVTATLDFAEMDILSYLSSFTGFPQSAEAFDEPVSKAIIEQLDVDLRLSAATAKAGALHLTNIAAVTQIRNGTAVFEMPDATAYGGKVQAHLKIGLDQGQLTGMIGMSCNDINSSAVADALSLTGLFPRGISSGNLDIRAPMERWSDLLKRANGMMKIRVANGQINSIGFQTLGGAGNRQTFFRLQDNAQTSDVFTSMNIDALIQDGVIVVDHGMIDYPSGTVQLNGVIPYGTASIALTTFAQPRTAKDAAPAPVIQHFIGGSWDNPYATPVLLPRPDH